jgi:hypothetical protein
MCLRYSQLQLDNPKEAPSVPTVFQTAGAMDYLLSGPADFFEPVTPRKA